MRRKARLFAASGLFLLILVISTSANPVRSKRSDEESETIFNTTLLLLPQAACAVGDIVYQVGESVPGNGPCEKCTCIGQSDDGSGINCQTVQCEVKAGCKALHRADHCCPLYQCECTRNGKVYSNGQKLEDPENPCQVCYCQGGEIVCNRIACFVRNDCQPIYVEGSCCPEYDHCPPRDIDRDQTTAVNSGDKITYLSDGPLKQDSKEYSKLDINNLPKIQIKEVTQGKPINNEIRIKEVIPVSTKAPTFPREIPKMESNDDDNETKNDINETNIETNENVNTPQIIRIGDQLLFLQQGDVIPENTSAVTPSPVFTVIGAEGLQRVDDPEDSLDKELTDEEINFKVSNNTPITPINEETESTDQSLNETVFEVYTTTSKDLITDVEDQEYTDTAQIYKEISNDGISTVNTNIDEPKLIGISTPSDNLEDDIQTVPVEHLPEHNPEYPPIPEDIMILSMTEDTLEPLLSEADFNGENMNPNLKSNNDEKIVIVKRPVIPLSLPKNSKNSNILRDNRVPEKILPDILPLIRVNKTNDERNESFVPEEWLKEGTEKPTFEINSPLLTLEAALPESILKVPSKTSTEEDDSNEYIFITNDTLKDSDVNIYKTDLTSYGPTEITTESFTDTVTLQGEYRSPGEPHLIPEWERNKTVEDSEDISTTQSSVTINEIINDDKTVSSVFIKDNITNDNEIEDEVGYPEDSIVLENNSSISNSPNVLEYSTFSNETNDDFENRESYFDKSSTTAGEVSTGSSDVYTNFIPSTEKLSSAQPTEKTNDDLATQRPLIQFESIRDEELLGLTNRNVFTQKQKKTSALIGDKNNNSGKKFNILADLINLVGDVAAIGHDTEVSTVLNSIDLKDENKYHKANNPTVEKDYAIPLDNAVINHDNIHENSQIELTEYNASGDKMDSEIPMENDKIEFTTRKVYIDKDMDETNTWKTEVGKDIELIPKVQKNPPKKDPSLEKIKDSNNLHINLYPKFDEAGTTARKPFEKDVIIYTTVRINPSPPPEHITVAPNKTKYIPDEFLETLISIDNSNRYEQPKKDFNSDTTEDSFASTIMKVTGRVSNTEESTNKIKDEGGEKLAKRETNSQMMSAKDIIDNKYLDALKSYFERRFIH